MGVQYNHWRSGHFGCQRYHHIVRGGGVHMYHIIPLPPHQAHHPRHLLCQTNQRIGDSLQIHHLLLSTQCQCLRLHKLCLVPKHQIVKPYLFRVHQCVEGDGKLGDPTGGERRHMQHPDWLRLFRLGLPIQRKTASIPIHPDANLLLAKHSGDIFPPLIRFIALSVGAAPFFLRVF